MALQEGIWDAAANGSVGELVVNAAASAAAALPQMIVTLNAEMQVAVCEVPNRTPQTPWSFSDNAAVTDASQPYPIYGWLSYD
jgi:hypothetical protein